MKYSGAFATAVKLAIASVSVKVGALRSLFSKALIICQIHIYFFFCTLISANFPDWGRWETPYSVERRLCPDVVSFSRSCDRVRKFGSLVFLRFVKLDRGRKDGIKSKYPSGNPNLHTNKSKLTKNFFFKYKTCSAFGTNP